MKVELKRCERSEEIEKIMACMDMLVSYDAHVRCDCRAFACQQHVLNRVYGDLRSFALYLAE